MEAKVGQVQVLETPNKLQLETFNTVVLFDKSENALAVADKLIFTWFTKHKKITRNKKDLSQIDGVFYLLKESENNYEESYGLYLLCDDQLLYLSISFQDKIQANRMVKTIQNFLGIEINSIVDTESIEGIETSTKLFIKNFRKSVLFDKTSGNFVIEETQIPKRSPTKAIKNFSLSCIDGIFVLNHGVYILYQGKPFCLFRRVRVLDQALSLAQRVQALYEAPYEIVRVIQSFIDIETVTATEIGALQALQTSTKLLVTPKPVNKILISGLALLGVSLLGIVWSTIILLAPSNFYTSTLNCEQAQASDFSCTLTGSYTLGILEKKITKDELATAKVESDPISLKTSTGELHLLSDSETLRLSGVAQINEFLSGKKNTLKLKLWGVNFLYWHGSFVILSLVGVFVSSILIGKNFYKFILCQTCTFDKNLDSLIVKRKVFQTDAISVPISQIEAVGIEGNHVSLKLFGQIQPQVFLSQYPLDASTARGLANLVRNFLG